MLPAFLQPVLEQFSALSGSRQFGSMGGVGPIPAEAMEQRLDRLGVGGQERQEWLAYWGALDGQFMTFQAEQQAKETKSRPGKTSGDASGGAPAVAVPSGHEEYGGGMEWELSDG